MTGLMNCYRSMGRIELYLRQKDGQRLLRCCFLKGIEDQFRCHIVDVSCPHCRCALQAAIWCWRPTPSHIVSCTMSPVRLIGLAWKKPRFDREFTCNYLAPFRGWNFKVVHGIISFMGKFYSKPAVLTK